MQAYRAILTLPGAALFSTTALFSRLPSSMTALGIVLLVHERTGQYGTGGRVVAAYVLALAVGAPLQGRLADSWGQGRVLSVAGGVFAAGLTGLLVAVELGAHGPWTHLAAAVAGVATPQTGAMVRSRWTHVLREDRERLPTAFALEAVLDEVVFIVGPVLVTFLTLSVHPLSGLAVAGAAGTLGGWAFALQQRTEPPIEHHTTQGRGSLSWGVLGPVMVAAVGIGAMFGSMEVVVVAYMTEQELRGWSGGVLAVWAAGSLVAGVLTGALRPPEDPVVRLRWTTVVLATLFLPLFVVPGAIWFTAVMFLAGFMIAPTLIAAMSVVETHVHPTRLTEGMAWTITALSGGIALGSVVVGSVLDAGGARAGFAVPLAAAAAAALVAWSFHPRPPASRSTRGLVPEPDTH